jgi:cysteine synthase A/argininosuccinate lyase
MGGAVPGLTATGIRTRLDDLRGKRVMVFVETPRTGAGFDVAAAATRRGVTPVVLIQEPDGLDRFIIDAYLDLGATVVCCDTGTTAAVVRACRALAANNELAGVASVYEYQTERAAEAARELGLPGPDPAAVRICRSKRLLRQALADRAGLNPEHAVVGTPEEALAAARRLGLPVVLKPTGLTGSAFVKRCDDAAEVRDMAAKILSLGSYHGTPVEPLAVVEKYLDGPEFSVEAMDGRALGVTAKEMSPGPYFVELAHTYPAPAPPELVDRVARVAEAALETVGLGTGPAHVEVKLDRALRRTAVIEVNPRLGGDRIPELIRLAQGISLAAAQVDALLGLPVNLVPSQRRVAVVRFLPTPAKGRLVRLTGLVEAAELDGVAEVAMEPEIGGDFYANGSNRDRVVHAIAVADTAADADSIARKAIERLTIEWADIPGELRYP